MNFFRRNSTKIPTPLAEPLCVGDSLPLAHRQTLHVGNACDSRAYGMTIELEVDAIELPKIRLRGSIFFYTPRRLPFAFAKRLEKKAGFRPTSKTAKTVTLIYRGHTYKHKL
jgi:hypothetical protein